MASARPTLRREASALVPDTHRDLLERPLQAALTTLLPAGRLQTHPVWFDSSERHLLVNTMRGFRKERNMRAEPRVSLLIVDPGPDVHWIEVRGLVELAEEWAHEHLDRLAGRYLGARRYFGEVVPAELSELEIPVIGRITPTRVVTDLDASATTPATTVPAPTLAPRPRVALPPSHLDLLVAPLRTVLSTRMPNGHPHTQPVWCEVDGHDVLVHTTAERCKGRNLLADPRATILVVDPADSSRWIEVRGDVEVTTDHALERLDRITRAYTGHPHYYGWVRPLCQRERETRIVCRIRPRRVVCDAIHR